MNVMNGGYWYYYVTFSDVDDIGSQIKRLKVTLAFHVFSLCTRFWEVCLYKKLFQKIFFKAYGNGCEFKLFEIKWKGQRVAILKIVVKVISLLFHSELLYESLFHFVYISLFL